MFSSSRLNRNGFSLGCWGSDLCLVREDSAPEVLLSPSRGMNRESSGVSSAGSSFSPAWGTGVHGCQEEATEGALQRAFFSSPGGLPLHKTELGPPERLELPDRIKEIDLEKDISYKNKSKGENRVRTSLTMFIQDEDSPTPPGSPPHGSHRHLSTEIKYTQWNLLEMCQGLPGRVVCRNTSETQFFYPTLPPFFHNQKLRISRKRKTRQPRAPTASRDRAACLYHQLKPARSRGIRLSVDRDEVAEGSDLLWGGT